MNNRTSSFLCCVVAIVLTTMVASAGNANAVCQRTWTTCADFAQGTLSNLECVMGEGDGQLQIKGSITLPFIWVPNLDTVSKVDTRTGKEVARYRTMKPYDKDLNPVTISGSPSRTTVDLQGNCWVGNRYAGTAVKIGLLEAGQWIDRNGNTVCDTSKDLNNDGDITGAELLPWGQDECVLYEVVLIPGSEATYVPGTYAGPYANDDWNPGPRSLAVDASNNLWVGCYGSQKFYYVDGATGAILNTVDVSSKNHHPYGATIDVNGVLWSSTLTFNHVLWLDPSTMTMGTIPLGHTAYGIALDYQTPQHLYVSGWGDQKLTRINVVTKTIDAGWPKPVCLNARGVVVTQPDGNVWVACSATNAVQRYDSSGVLLATIPVGAEPTGVAIDIDGNIWVTDKFDQDIHRINPATNTVDLTKTLLNSVGHYTYSDMTGAALIAFNQGTWVGNYDSGMDNAGWCSISWSGSTPTGASVVVRARASNDLVTWSAWETVVNGATPPIVATGRYLQIEVTLHMGQGGGEFAQSETSPILYDLTAEFCCEPITTLYQAYPGDSNGANTSFAGNAGTDGEVISAVPGVLKIVPGDKWRNFVTADPTRQYGIKAVTLLKEHPDFIQCTLWNDKPDVKQRHPSGSIRLWWPLMYEAPGTKWTLEVTWVYVGEYTAHTDTLTWNVDANFASVKNVIKLFHELPFGTCEIPLISDEVLYSKLLAGVDNIEKALPDMSKALKALLAFEDLVGDHCIYFCPRTTMLASDTINGTLGITNTSENPACCKLIADAEYLGFKLGIFGQSK